jgi:hypothetical protein
MVCIEGCIRFSFAVLVERLDAIAVARTAAFGDGCPATVHDNLLAVVAQTTLGASKKTRIGLPGMRNVE